MQKDSSRHAQKHYEYETSRGVLAILGVIGVGLRCCPLDIKTMSVGKRDFIGIPHFRPNGLTTTY